MNALPDSSEFEVHRWIRELIGARGLFRALDDSKIRKRIQELVLALDEGAVGKEEVRAAFARAAYQQHGGIEELLATFEKLPRSRPAPRPAVQDYKSSRSGPAVAVAVQKASNHIEALKLEIESVRRHCREMEHLIRTLVERSVLDATRIRGLEAGLMALAERADSSRPVEEAYSSATSRFLADRFGK